MTAAFDRVLGVVMGKLTADAQQRRNVFWTTAAALLNGAGTTLFLGGELWGGFLTQSGFSMSQIGWLTSAGMFAGAIGLLAFLGLADRVRNRIRTYVLCVLVMATAPFVTVVVALLPREILPLAGLFSALAAVHFLSPLVGSIPQMLDYPIVVRTVSPEIRGRLFGIWTTAFGALAILTGILSANVLKNVAYPWGYAWCFMIGGILIFMRAGAFSRLREVPDLSVPGASRSVLPFAAFVDVLRMKEFQWLAGPHVLRGLTSSMVIFAIPLALEHLHMPEHIPGYAASVRAAAAVLGGIALGFVADRWGAGRTTLFADVLFALGLGAMMLFHSPLIFLAIYLVLVFGMSIEGSAVPFGCTIIVPVKLMGAFSSLRLMILLGSTAVGAPIFGYLFDHYEPSVVLLIGAALKLFNGLWFWYVFQLKKVERQAHNMRPRLG